MTKAKASAKVQLLTEEGDPLLATGRFGLGSSAAFTSDATSQWASEWLDWRGYGKFWSQLLRSVMRSADSSGISVERVASGPESVLRIRCSDEAGRPRDFLDWDASISYGERSAPAAPRQVGCGLYELSFPSPRLGEPCSVRLADKSRGRVKTADFDSGSPKEYQLSAVPPEAFKALRRLSQGASAIDGLPASSSPLPLRAFLCLLALLLCLLGILLRRL